MPNGDSVSIALFKITKQSVGSLIFRVSSLTFIFSVFFPRDSQSSGSSTRRSERRNENFERLCHRIIANLRRMQTVADDNDAAA